MSLISHSAQQRISQRLELTQNTINARLAKRSRQTDVTRMNTTQLRHLMSRYEKHRPTPSPDRAIAMQNRNILERHAQDAEDAFKELDTMGRIQHAARVVIQDALEPSTLTRVMAASTGVSLPTIEAKYAPPKLIKACDSQLAKTLNEHPERVAQISEQYRAKMSAEEWYALIKQDYQLIQYLPTSAPIEIIKSVSMYAAKTRAEFLKYYTTLRSAISDEKFDCLIYDAAIITATQVKFVDVLRYVPATYQTFDRLVKWIENMPQIIGYAAYGNYTSAELLYIAERLMCIDPKNAPKLLLTKNYHEYLIGQDALLCKMIEACPSCVRYPRAIKIFDKDSYWFMAVKRCPDVYKLLPERWLACDTKETILLAMCAARLQPENIRYMKNQPELCVKIAVKLDPTVAQYIKDQTMAKKYGVDQLTNDILGSKATAVQLD